MELLENIDILIHLAQSNSPFNSDSDLVIDANLNLLPTLRLLSTIEKSDIIRKNQNNYLIQTLDQKEKNLLLILESRLKQLEGNLAQEILNTTQRIESATQRIESGLILNRILRKLGIKK